MLPGKLENLGKGRQVKWLGQYLPFTRILPTATSLPLPPPSEGREESL